MIKDINLKELKEINNNKDLILKFCYKYKKFMDFDVYDLNKNFLYSVRVLK
jgi:hypothetical protein